MKKFAFILECVANIDSTNNTSKNYYLLNMVLTGAFIIIHQRCSQKKNYSSPKTYITDRCFQCVFFCRVGKISEPRVKGVRCFSIITFLSPPPGAKRATLESSGPRETIPRCFPFCLLR